MSARPTHRGAPGRGRPRPWPLAVLLTAVLVAAGALAAGPAAARTAYITDFNSGTVTPIETADDTAGTPIPVGSGSGSEPVAIAISPDGETVYVVLEADGEVVPIEVATNLPGAPIEVGENPQAIAIAPDGKTAYVANFDDGTVTPIDLEADPPVAEAAIAVGTHPQGIAISPDGASAYVVNQGSETVTPIDTVTRVPGSAIGVGKEPAAIAVLPDGATAYVAVAGDDEVVPIDLANDEPGGTIAVGDEPSAIAITPDAAKAYVANSAGDDVTPIDLAGDDPLAPIGGVSEPQGIAITPDGATAYVAEFGAAGVTPIDTQTDAPGTAITVGDQPYGIAIVPDQPPVAAFTVTPGGIGGQTSFDGAGSHDPDGTVASYHWDFGDGEEETTSSATVEHVYAHAGTYTATLTVADAEGCSTELVFTGQTASCNGSPLAEDSDPVTIAKATPTLVTAASPGVVLGGAVHDTATLGGGQAPSGQINFRLYGPDDSTCAGPPAFTTAPVAVSGAGQYRSPDVVPTAAGTYRWIAEYSGDGDNEAVAGACDAAGESVTVTPAPEHTLTVVKAGSGSGTVASTDGAIECGPTCSHAFAVGATVTLVATPAPGSAFAGWSGAGCAGTASCAVTLGAEQTVTAVFEATPPPSNQFTIGRPRLNKRKGTARLPVTLPGPGTLVLVGKGLVKMRRSPATAGRLRLTVKPRGAVGRKLRRTGKAVVRVRVTFTPVGGSPLTKVKRVRLIERHRE